MIYKEPLIYKQGLTIEDVKDSINWEDRTDLINFDNHYFDAPENRVKLYYSETLRLLWIRFNAHLINLVVNDNNYYEIANFSNKIHINLWCDAICTSGSVGFVNKIAIQIYYTKIVYKCATAASDWFMSDSPIIIPGKITE